MKKLAVLLPTYNAAVYLCESIDSVLNQSFADFDLFIYDDFSTDNTEEIVLKYNDSRLFYRKNTVNSGIAVTLNKGLEELLPLYEFIARMDADDWCYPARFEKQLNFLDKHKETIMCGTQGYWLKDIKQNPVSGWKYPLRNEYIQYNLLFAASFGHSSVFLRSSFFQNHNLRYNETISTCEDWDFWIRVAKIGSIANLPDFMMKYRIVENSNHRSPNKTKQLLGEKSAIISNYWAYFNIHLSHEEVFDYYVNGAISKKDFLEKVVKLIKAFNLLNATAQQNFLLAERKDFSYMLARRILGFWKRSEEGRYDPFVWIMIIKEVKFIGTYKLIRSLIK